MPSESYLLKRILRSFRRVYPRCSMTSQAIAFNLFLAFFPTILFAVGFASGWLGTKVATMDAIKDFISFLPPGSQSIVAEFLTRRSQLENALLGWAGTLLAGSPGQNS
jgi:uncharacterized BrkB/YihY/UPF0761 family membrane protein